MSKAALLKSAAAKGLNAFQKFADRFGADEKDIKRLTKSFR